MARHLCVRAVSLVLIVASLSSAALFAMQPAAIAAPASANTPHDHVHDDTHTHIHSPTSTTQPESIDLTPYACEEHGLETIWGGFCTHGNDSAAEMGLDLNPRAAMDSLTTTTTGICDGDGVSGPRIQLLYAYTPSSVNSFDYVKLVAPGWAIGADALLYESARRMGGNRHFRFVHDANCQPTIEKVLLTEAGDDHFGATLMELYNMGYNRTDRRYLVFMESYVLCGVSVVVPDDQPGSQNASNFGVNYARVDRPCWGPEVAAHEAMHMLGAVQNSAPNSSGGGHCTDEWDVMCYSDIPYFPPMRIVCQDFGYAKLLDCNGDDYFNPHPEPGSYLATHWNSADSIFLIVGPDPPPCPDEALEPDHNYDTARVMRVGETQHLAFCNQYDFDLVRIDGEAGKTYRIETRNLAPGVDTGLSLYLYNRPGYTFLGFDDNGNGLLASRITYTPTVSGPFYVDINEVNLSYGSHTTYDLVVVHPSDDTTPPTSAATISPAPSASGWNRGPVTVTLNAADNPGGSGVHSLTWVVDGPEFIPSKTVHGDTGVSQISRQGISTIYWVSKDAEFNTEAIQSQEVRIDRRPPTVTLPSAGLASSLDSSLAGARAPVTIAWSGEDRGGSGIAGYRLQRSSDGGATWTTVARANPTATSETVLVKPGTHVFRVRTIDGAGNLSQWGTTEPVTVETHQERSHAIAWSGDWRRGAWPGAWGGFATTTGASGATATFTFNGSGVAWVSETVPGHRRAEIWLDGAIATTLDLYSISPRRGAVVWSATVPAGNHVLEIRMLGPSTSDLNHLSVDGFIVMR